jgi:hypothetical protein
VFALLPDLDQVLVTFLTGHAALAPLHAGRVGTQLASGDTPAIRTSSLGGAQPWPWEARQEFQIESWGGNQGAAKLLARTVEAAVYELIGPVTGGYITGVAVTLSQLWSPDDQTGRARYRTDVALTIYPA